MPLRRCLGQQRVPWGERHAERDAGHLAQELAPGTAMDAVSTDNLLCTFVQTHSAHLTFRDHSTTPPSASRKIPVPFRVCIE
jgi:hypothetical protein